MTTERAVFIGVIAALCLYIAYGERHRGASPAPPGQVDLVGQASVIDGDTIIIHGTHIRLAGIDAPESGQSCKAADGSSYLCGQKAAFVLADMLKDKTVNCQDTGERSYKRVIGRCFVGGVDVQGAMVRQGWAIAYRRYSQAYVGDEDQAHAAHAGIWAGAFVEPETWRHDKSARN